MSAGILLACSNNFGRSRGGHLTPALAVNYRLSSTYHGLINPAAQFEEDEG